MPTGTHREVCRRQAHSNGTCVCIIVVQYMKWPTRGDGVEVTDPCQERQTLRQQKKGSDSSEL